MNALASFFLAFCTLQLSTWTVRAIPTSLRPLIGTGSLAGSVAGVGPVGSVSTSSPSPSPTPQPTTAITGGSGLSANVEGSVAGFLSPSSTPSPSPVGNEVFTIITCNDQGCVADVSLYSCGIALPDTEQTLVLLFGEGTNKISVTYIATVEKDFEEEGQLSNISWVSTEDDGQHITCSAGSKTGEPFGTCCYPCSRIGSRNPPSLSCCRACSRL